MPRSTPAALLTAFRSASFDPVYLMQLVTGGTPATVYYTNYDAEVEFGGLTWIGRPFNRAEVSHQGSDQSGTLSILLSDHDGNWKTLLDAGADFIGQEVTFFLTDATLLGSGSALTDAFREDYKVEHWERVEHGIRLDLKSFLSILDLEVPRRTITRRHFPGIPDVNAVI